MWPIVSRLCGGCVAAVWRCERPGADLDVAGAGLGVVDGEGELELLALRDVLEVDVRVVAGAIVEGRRGVVADGDAVRAAEDREDDGRDAVRDGAAAREAGRRVLEPRGHEVDLALDLGPDEGGDLVGVLRELGVAELARHLRPYESGLRGKK